MRSFVESMWAGVIRSCGSRLVVALGIASLISMSVSLRAQSISYAGVQSVLSVTGLEAPLGIAVDGAGNRYIANNGSPDITKISANGTQTTIPSTLMYPSEIASDAVGNLYVADTGNSRVLRIAVGGGAQTTVGTGWMSPFGVAVDSVGNVYVTDIGPALTYEVAVGGAQTVVAQSYLSSPYALAVDFYNNLYITDVGDNSLVEVTAAGVASYRINNGLNASPTGVAVDKFGNIFVSSSTEGPGYLELYGANGSVRQLGSFVAPYGLATDALGNVYVADPGANAINVLAPGAVDMGQGNLCPVSSPQPCTQTVTLNFNVQALNQNLSNVVVKVATQGGENLDFTATSDTCTGSFTTLTICAIGIQFKPLAAGIRLGAVDIVGVVASNGDDLRSNGHSNAVVRKAHHNSNSQNAHPDFVFPDGATELATVYLNGIGSGPLAGFDAGLINTLPINLAQTPFISGVAADTNGGLFIVDSSHCVVSEYVAATGLTSVVAGSGTCAASAGDGGLATAATFQEIYRVAVNARGDLFIPDYSACVIRKVDGLTGIINTIAGTANARGYSPDGVVAIDATLSFPLDIAVDGSGNLFYVDYQEALVRRIDVSSGVLTTVAGNFASGPGFSGDGGLATDAQLSLPIGLAIDSAANIYIADLLNNVIRKVTASTGIITTAAGQGPPVQRGYGGDGGPATSALLSNPEGVGVDAAGNIYIADTVNFLIRKVDSSTGIITTAAGVYDGGGNNQNGNQRYTGDGGAANLAGFGDILDVAVDGSGNIYIADTENYVVRKVTAASGIATFGSFPEDSFSPAINVALTNNGNASLDLSDLLASSNFNLGGSETSCGGSSQLPPGASCELGIEFHPLAVGSLNGTIIVTDNVGNNNAATQAVALHGVGLALTASKLALADVPATVGLGGNLGTIPVSVENNVGNVVTNSTVSITVTITGPHGYTHTVTLSAVNGVATFNLAAVTFSTAGSYTITATSSPLTPATASFTVTTTVAGAKLALPSLPATLIAGGNLGTVAVSVEDSSGGVVTGSTASVTLTIAGPHGYLKTITVAAVNGVASFNLTAYLLSTNGAYTITATSLGLESANHSFAVTQDFTLGSTGASSSQTVTAGGAAVFDLTLAPAGSSFTSPITLSATGLPPAATYTFNPAIVTPGVAAATTTLTINTAVSTAALHKGEGMPWGFGGITVATLLLPWASSRTRRKMCRASGLPLLFAVLMIGIAATTGCAAGGLFGHPPQTKYNITVTGTSGSLVHSTIVTLIVQ